MEIELGNAQIHHPSEYYNLMEPYHCTNSRRLIDVYPNNDGSFTHVYLGPMMQYKLFAISPEKTPFTVTYDDDTIEEISSMNELKNKNVTMIEWNIPDKFNSL